MTKWADYLVSAVHYVNKNGRRYIGKLMVHVDNGDTVSQPSVWTRQQVIDKIDEGFSFLTIIKGADGKWKKGQKIQKVVINGVFYLKTIPNKTEDDNLGELPEF